MNYLDGYVEEVLSEPYYDDYGSGIFRWWVEVSYVKVIKLMLRNLFHVLLIQEKMVTTTVPNHTIGVRLGTVVIS